MENSKQYIAFISYKREDEKWAKWIQDKLEHYNLPTSLKKSRPDLPKQVRPIFRDTTDLSGGVLEEAIDNALSQSAYLIVICSPLAAKSQWVCKEVLRFIELGKAENIIPFIVDGTPYSDDNKECFPASLKSLSGKKELLGININENGKEAALVKVVARIFNLSFDTLWQRHLRGQKRRLRRMLLAVSAIILFLCGVIMHLQDKNRTILLQKEQLQNDSILMAQHLERIKADSVKLSEQNDSILLQKKELHDANVQLVKTNDDLRLKTDIALKNQAIAIAARSISHTDNGDSYLGRILALESLRNRPQTLEAEHALRHSHLSNDAQYIGHTQQVNCVDISSDDKYIISGSNDMVIVWDKNLGSIVKELDLLTGHAVSVQFSKDDEYALIASSIEILLLETNHWTTVHQYNSGHDNSISEVAFGPDSTIVSCDWDGYVVVWDLAEESVRYKFKAHDRGKTGIDFSPSGQYMVTKSNIQYFPMKVWETNDYNLIYGFHLKENCSVDEAVFSPDGELLLATLGASKLKLYRIPTWEEAEERNIELLGCESACYSPDNNLIALGSTYSGGITLLDAHTLDTVAVYNCDGKVKSCVFSHDSKFLIACDMNKNLYSWDLTYKIPYEKRFTIGNVTQIDVSDEKCLILTDDKKLLEYRTNLYGSYELVASYVIPNNVHDIHNVNDGIMCSHIEMQLVGPKDKVINMSLPGISIFAKKRTVVSVYDLKSERLLFEVICDAEVKRVVISNDSRYIAIADTIGNVTIYDLSSKEIVDSCKTISSSGVNSMSFNSECSNLLMSDYNGVSYLYDLDAKSYCYFDEHTNMAYSTFGNNDVFATYSADGSIICWDVSTKRKIAPVITGLGWLSIDQVSFFDDSNRIIAVYEDRIGMWDVNSSKVILDFEYPKVKSAVMVDRTNTMFVLADGVLTAYKFPTLQQLIEETAHKMQGRELTREERSDNYIIDNL